MLLAIVPLERTFRFMLMQNRWHEPVQVQRGAGPRENDQATVPEPGARRAARLPAGVSLPRFRSWADGRLSTAWDENRNMNGRPVSGSRNGEGTSNSGSSPPNDDAPGDDRQACLDPVTKTVIDARVPTLHPTTAAACRAH
jgi:hypothetical protein